MYHYAGVMVNGAVTLEKFGNDSAIPLKKTEHMFMQKLYMNVYSSIAHDSQKVETT